MVRFEILTGDGNNHSRGRDFEEAGVAGRFDEGDRHTNELPGGEVVDDGLSGVLVVLNSMIDGEPDDRGESNGKDFEPEIMEDEVAHGLLAADFGGSGA